MSRTDTWMPLYIADYLADTRRLTLIQHGAYLLLLMEYWRHGPLPNDDRELMSIVQTDKKTWDKEIKTSVRRFFSVGDDGLLHQKRIDAERAKTAELSIKRRAAAKQKGKKSTTTNKQDDDESAAKTQQDENKSEAIAEHLPTHAGVARQSQLQSQLQGSELRSGAAAPEPPTMRDTLWRDGAPIVRRLTGLPEIRVRALLGSLLKSTQDDCARLYRVLREADDLRPVDPVAWLKAACNDGRQRKPGRLADSLAGIYGIEPNGRAPTLDLYPDEYRTDQ